MAALTTQRTESRHERAHEFAMALISLALLISLGVGAVVLGASPDWQLHALKAAGEFKGEKISGVETLVEHLKGNVVWFGITVMGLVGAVIGILFLAGHSRAGDMAIRTLVGVMILASISGIVA